MNLLLVSVAAYLSCQIQHPDTARQQLRVAVAVVGPTAGRERAIHEAFEIEMARALQNAPYRLIRGSPPLLWSVFSDDMRALEDTAVLRLLDPPRKALRLDVLIATFIIRSDPSQVVMGGAVYSEGSPGQQDLRFVGRGTTLKRAIRNLADVVAADLRRKATARDPKRRPTIPSPVDPDHAEWRHSMPGRPVLGHASAARSGRA